MSSQTFVDETPVETVDELVDWMRLGGRPRERWVVGTEHEKLGFWPDLGRAPTWEGPRGIGALFETLAREAGYHAAREGDDIIALSRGGATITLEPGGQLELSGAPLKRLVETEAELDAHFAEIRRFSAPLGIEWSGLGIAPGMTPEQAPKMPKRRYAIMRSYLPTRGKLGLHMMHLTCTVQANLDFDTEHDAMRKFRAALMLQPLIIALFANSTVVEGRVVPERSFRSAIWDDTDRVRCELPDALLRPEATLRDYVEWALDVPMFFIHRGDEYVPCFGLPFRRFLTEGFQGERANVGDFALHLSTLFPDVRLKRHLEVRAADMGDRAHVLALPAVHKGLLYDDDALGEAWEMFREIKPEAWRAARLDVERGGLAARLGHRTSAEWWRILLPRLRAGLERCEPGTGRMLDCLAENLDRGECPADEVRRTFTGDVGALMARTRLC
ncbi:glutamate-cysteine ligase family protein [Myxococcota bacterium]|nr:glutamate-cysteine ligase family protein [Myxococcota bacterium]